MYVIYYLCRIFNVHLLIFINIMFNIFSTYIVIMSIANLTSIPNDSCINPIAILYTKYICINFRQPMHIS